MAPEARGISVLPWRRIGAPHCLERFLEFVRLLGLVGLSFLLILLAATAFGQSGYLKPSVSAKVLKRAEGFHAEGVELYKRRSYRAALRKFVSAERVCPDLFSAGYHVALVHRKMGNEEAAIGQLKKLNKLFPENIIGHNDLGVIYASKDTQESNLLAHLEFGMAIRNGENLLKGEGKNIPQVRVDLAMAYANLGASQLKETKFADAEKSFRKSVEHYPLAFFGHFGLGNALLAMKRFGEAKTAYRKAQEIEPRNNNVHIALAKCHLFGADRNPRFALAELKKVRGNRPPAEMFDLLGDTHALLGNNEEAIANYLRYLGMSERSPQTLYKVGVLCYNGGSRADAKTYLQEFVTDVTEGSEESRSTAHKLLGDIWRQEKDYEKAISHYLKGAGLREAYLSCYYGLADSYFHLEEAEKAKEYVLLVLKGLPASGNAKEDELRQKASSLLKRIGESESH